MAQPRPSLTLVLDIDERLDGEEVRLEIDRCYAHVGTTIVRNHASATVPAQTFAQATQASAKGAIRTETDAQPKANVQTKAESGKNASAHTSNAAAQKEENGFARVENEPEPINAARMLVKLGTRKYLHSTDEGADKLWNDVVAKWLFNEFHKVGNNLQIFNRRQNEIGNNTLDFTWLDVELQNGEVCIWMHLDSESGIDPYASEHISRMRELLNSDALGTDVSCVVMPDPTDYQRQFEEGMKAKAQREEAKQRAQEEAEAKAAAQREEATKLADEAFLESPLEDIDNARARELEEAELAAKFDLPEPDFAIDYHLWRIEYANGTTRTFDSKTGTFAD